MNSADHPGENSAARSELENSAAPGVPAPPDATPVSGNSSGRRWAILLGLAAVMFLMCGGAGVWWFRGDMEPVTPASLAAAESLWKANGPENYDLAVELQGDSPGVFVLEVREGRVKTAPTRNGIPIRARHTWETWTIEGQFDTIRRELELAAAPAEEMKSPAAGRLVLQGNFDPVFGYPRRFHRIVFGNGPEVYWEVKRFQPVP